MLDSDDKRKGGFMKKVLLFVFFCTLLLLFVNYSVSNKQSDIKQPEPKVQPKVVKKVKTSSASKAITSKPKKSFRERLLDWPITRKLRFVPVDKNAYVIPKRPKVPPVLRNMLIHGTARGTKADRIGNIINLLIAFHPEDRIRKEMNAAVYKDKLITISKAKDITTANHSIATMIFVPADDLRKAGVEPQIEGMNAMLIVDVEYFKTPKTDDDILYSMIVLEHEYQHYLDFMAMSEKDKFSMTSGRILDNQEDIDRSCKNKYEMERSAYTSQCAIQMKWGLRHEKPPIEICDFLFDEKHFKKFVYFIMVSSADDRSLNECGMIWATQAGHPNLENLLNAN